MLRKSVYALFVPPQKITHVQNILNCQIQNRFSTLTLVYRILNMTLYTDCCLRTHILRMYCWHQNISFPFQNLVSGNYL